MKHSQYDPVFFHLQAIRMIEAKGTALITSSCIRRRANLSCGISGANEDGIQLEGLRDDTRGAGVIERMPQI